MGQTRSDIACSVRLAVDQQSWKLVNRILRFSGTTINQKLVHGRTNEFNVTAGCASEFSDLNIDGLSDSGWAGCNVSRKSISGSLVPFDKNLVM